MSHSEENVSDRLPEVHKERFNCPHCGAYAGQSWAPLVVPSEDSAWEYLETDYVDTMDEFNSSRRNIWYTTQCASCHSWSIWRRDTMVFPAARVGNLPHPDMPSPVRDIYLEATAVAQVSRRAGAAMARAAIEKLIKIIDEEAPKKANLDARIKRLQGRVSTPLGKLLEVVRVTGNNALHGGEGFDDVIVLALNDQEGPQILTILLAASNDLVDELISRPRVLNSLWDSLPQAIRERSAFREGE